MSGDYSRKTFKANHNYSGVLMQQGRVHLDADWNEQVEINLRRQRAETVDIIGRAVVPMETLDGFKVELNAGQLSIYPGRMYVDGLLAENHGTAPNQFYSVLDEKRGTQPVLYQDQPFFPNAQLIAPLPSSGAHIAYLDTWQREVTYLQEPGLVEPAVGVDTTARWQTVWQVKVLEFDSGTNVELECGDQVDAWDELTAPSAGRLTTEIVEPQEEDNVCLVPTEGGYRALENRLYRVEIHDGGSFDTATFKWARHNASIETAVNEINGVELLVAQPEWDQNRAFKQEDWVEITDDIRELAGLPGEIRRIAGVVVGSNTITLDAALPAADFPTATVIERHTRIKRWDQQNEVDETTGLLTVGNTPFYVESGIQVNFSLDADLALSGEFKTGDYWLFYARSATASIEMLDQAPPRGIHHHYARLAVLNFPDDQDDCRIHWPPHFGNSCCCTVTVGDGDLSHGEFISIQEAINNLPLTGGKICVLPGLYTEHIEIRGKLEITISGCGDRTRISSRDESDFVSTPVVLIENSKNITIENLAIAATHRGAGVYINQTEQIPDDFSARHDVINIIIDNLIIHASFSSAVHCEVGQDIQITNNLIQMENTESPWPGIYSVGRDVLIRGNSVTVRQVDSAEMIGRGGIQLGGLSERVRVLNNYIHKGIGDGISLGSMSIIDANDEPIVRSIALFMRADDDCDSCGPPAIRLPGAIDRVRINPELNGLIPLPGRDIEDIFVFNPNDDVPNPPRIVSSGDLYEIYISNNRIENMGRNGIGVIGFFDLDETDEFISVDNLSISHNLIEGCLNTTLPVVDSSIEDDTGYGGIVLGDVLNLRIHDNQIINNGTNPLDAVCGVYVLHAEGVEICDNRIIENGQKANDDVNYKVGARSGIHLVYAITPTITISLGNTNNLPRQNGIPAAKIHNNIVVHPVGKALTINALGPVTVTDNQFTSRGVIRGQESSKVSTVSILNLGLSNELYLQILSFSQLLNQKTDLSSLAANIKTSNATSVTFIAGNLDDFKLGRYLANGNVMFSNNQVVLDELDTITNSIVSATRIFSLDDVSFNNNQCDYSLLGDFVFFPNLLLAPSLRITNNRFKESLAGALFSVFAFGFMNTTTNNQATHCIISRGLPRLTVVKDNIELLDLFLINDDGSICDLFNKFLGEQ